MVNFCGFCGKELDPNTKFCTGCGKPVEQKEESIIPKPSEQPSEQPSGQPVAQTLTDQGQASNINNNQLNVQQPRYNAAGAPVVTAKKNKTGLIIGIVAAIVVLCLGAIIFAIVSFINNPTNDDSFISNGIENRVNTDSYMVEGITEDGQPTGNRMTTYTIDDDTFILYGKVNGVEKDTPIHLNWWGETMGIGMLDDEVTVYTDKQGSFNYILKSTETKYGVADLMYSGNYSITIRVDEDEEPIDRVEFSINSSSKGKQLYSELIADFYMIQEVAEKQYDEIQNYPVGANVLKAQICYFNVPTQTKIYDKWYKLTNDEWNQITFDEVNIRTIAENGGKGLHNFFITSKKGWESGKYKVELYLDDTELMAIKEFTVGETGSATSDGTETATPNATQQDVKVTDVYAFDDMDQWVAKDGFPSTVEAIYCHANLEGVTAETELFVTWEDWITGDILYSFMATTPNNGAHVFDFYPSDFGMDAFPLGTYQIGIYDAYYEEKLLGSVAFDMMDPNGGEGELSDGEDGFVDIALVDLTQDEWIELNNWLNGLTDSRLSATNNTWDYTDQELIDFAITYCVLSHDDEIVNTLDDGGYYWVDQQTVNEVIDYYFDIAPIESPQSTELVVFDSETGRYGTYGGYVEEWPLNFPRVSEVYDLGDNFYEIVFDVYSAPVWFDGNPNGNPDDWQSASEMPEYIGTMDAIYERVNGDEKILLSYEWY